MFTILVMLLLIIVAGWFDAHLNWPKAGEHLQNTPNSQNGQNLQKEERL